MTHCLEACLLPGSLLMATHHTCLVLSYIHTFAPVWQALPGSLNSEAFSDLTFHPHIRAAHTR